MCVCSKILCDKFEHTHTHGRSKVNKLSIEIWILKVRKRFEALGSKLWNKSREIDRVNFLWTP